MDGFPAVGAEMFESDPDVVGDFLDRKALWGSRWKIGVYLTETQFSIEQLKQIEAMPSCNWRKKGWYLDRRQNMFSSLILFKKIKCF